MAKEPMIIILHKEDGELAYNRETFTVSEIGTVPVVGDLIAMSGVRQGLNRNEAKSRKVYEVMKRYFVQPDADNGGEPQIALVVKVRPGEDSEMQALGS